MLNDIYECFPRGVLWRSMAGWRRANETKYMVVDWSPRSVGQLKMLRRAIRDKEKKRWLRIVNTLRSVQKGDGNSGRARTGQMHRREYF